MDHTKISIAYLDSPCQDLSNGGLGIAIALLVCWQINFSSACIGCPIQLYSLLKNVLNWVSRLICAVVIFYRGLSTTKASAKEKCIGLVQTGCLPTRIHNLHIPLAQPRWWLQSWKEWLLTCATYVWRNGMMTVYDEEPSFLFCSVWLCNNIFERREVWFVYPTSNESSGTMQCMPNNTMMYVEERACVSIGSVCLLTNLG